VTRQVPHREGPRLPCSRRRGSSVVVGLLAAGRALQPHRSRPEPDYPYGVLIVTVLGVPYLGTVALAEAEADAVATEAVVPNIDEDAAGAV
jgi:hypothetical protein